MENKESTMGKTFKLASGAMVAFLKSLSSEPVAVEAPEEVQQQITVLGVN